jgi:hypothetical protein
MKGYNMPGLGRKSRLSRFHIFMILSHRDMDGGRIKFTASARNRRMLTGQRAEIE